MTDSTRKLPGTQALIASALLTALYIAAEVYYNTHLLAALSRPDFGPASLDRLEVLGKGLAAFGIALVVTRILRMSILSRLLGGIVLFISLYFGLGYAMDKAIENLSGEAKHQGHWLGIGRVALLHDPIGSFILIHGIKTDAGKQIALANMALLYHSDTDDVRRLADRYLDRRIKAESNDYRYTIREKLDESWRKYAYLTNQLLPVWNWYRAEAKKENGRNATHAEFIEALEVSTRYRKLINAYTGTEVFAGNKEYGLPRVTGRDIPLFLSKPEMHAFIDKKIAEFRQIVKQQFLPGGEEGKRAQLTHDLAASIFIPPLSMTLSLFSIILNTLSLACITITLLMRQSSTIKIRLVQSAVVMVVTYGLLQPSSSILENNMHFGSAMERVAESGVMGKVWVWVIGKESIFLQLAN